MASQSVGWLRVHAGYHDGRKFPRRLVFFRGSEPDNSQVRAIAGVVFGWARGNRAAMMLPYGSGARWLR